MCTPVGKVCSPQHDHTTRTHPYSYTDGNGGGLEGEPTLHGRYSSVYRLLMVLILERLSVTALQGIAY